MSRRVELTSIFVLFCFLFFVSTFSFSNFVVNEYFYFSLNIARILLVAIIGIIIFFLWGVKKYTTLCFCLLISFFALSDSYYFSLAYLMAISLCLMHFLYLLSDKNKVKVISILSYTILLAYFLIVFLGYLGVIPNIIYDSQGEFSLTENRFSLGFTNPNQGAFLAFSIFLTFFLIKNNFGMLLSFSVFLLSNIYFISKSSIALFILFVFFYLILFNRFLKKFLIYSFLIFLIFYPFFVVKYISIGQWSLFGINLDLLLTTRLSDVKRTFEFYNGIGFFPVRGDLFVDSGISNILIKGGWFLYVIFLLAIYFYLRREADERYLLVFLILIIYLFVENILNGNVFLVSFMLARLIYLLKHFRF